MTVRNRAVESYRNVEISSAVLAATSHELISILYDRVSREIETMLASQVTHSLTIFRTSQLKALELIRALSGGVDRRSGQIAHHLFTVYHGLSESIGRAQLGDEIGALSETLAVLNQLEEAWQQVG